MRDLWVSDKQVWKWVLPRRSTDDDSDQEGVQVMGCGHFQKKYDKVQVLIQQSVAWMNCSRVGIANCSVVQQLLLTFYFMITYCIIGINENFSYKKIYCHLQGC